MSFAPPSFRFRLRYFALGTQQPPPLTQHGRPAAQQSPVKQHSCGGLQQSAPDAQQSFFAVLPSTLATDLVAQHGALTSQQSKPAAQQSWLLRQQSCGGLQQSAPGAQHRVCLATVFGDSPFRFAPLVTTKAPDTRTANEATALAINLVSISHSPE